MKIFIQVELFRVHYDKPPNELSSKVSEEDAQLPRNFS